MYSLVIFDWDGTLMNSTERIVSCLGKAAQKTGLPLLDDLAYQQIIGLGLWEAISYLYPEANAEQITTMREHYGTFFVAAEQTPNPLFPGAQGLLEELSDKGVLTAVATGKSRRGLDRVWQATGYGKYFNTSRCADETASKPIPLMLEEIVKELDVDISRTVMVGDTSFDLEMAQQLNMDRVGVSYGAHTVETLQKFEPLAILDSIADLRDIIY